MKEAVCFATPPSKFLMDQRVFPSLGILKVAATLEKAGHYVEHLDLAGVVNYEDVVRDYAMSRPDIRTYALTATSPQMPSAAAIARTLRAAQPTAKIILGGPHPTLVHIAAKKFPNARTTPALTRLQEMFDVLVAGDGEKAIFEALAIDHGLVDADDPKSSLWLSHQDFSASAWPARHLLDMDSYHYTVEGERASSIISQIGCPMGCHFCSGRNSPMLRQIRLRDSADAVAEIVHLYAAYGYKGCFLLDDEVNVNRQMLETMRLLKEAAERLGIEWRLRAFIKSELFTDEQAEAMYEAGFRHILIGFESGDDRILLNIKKNATREDNTRAMAIAHRHRLKVKALMSLGHAGESEASIRATRDWLLEVRPHDVDMTIITPYPGSPYFDQATYVEGNVWVFTAPKTGDALYMEDVDFTEEAQFYKGAPGEYRSYVWTDHISRERLVEMRDELEMEVRTALSIPFYSSGAAMSIEASMGQTPMTVLRTTAMREMSV